MLKAIETRYKGYRFRSRLEARWAVFFDALSVPWEYEKEGYDLGKAGLYLPDFQIDRGSLWIEIKPTIPTVDETNKAFQLAIDGAGIVIIVAGTPGEEKIWVVTPPDALGPNVTDGYPVWCDLFRPCPKICSAACPKVSAAYTAARSARFEHGERP